MQYRWEYNVICMVENQQLEKAIDQFLQDKSPCSLDQILIIIDLLLNIMDDDTESNILVLVSGAYTRLAEHFLNNNDDESAQSYFSLAEQINNKKNN